MLLCEPSLTYSVDFLDWNSTSSESGTENDQEEENILSSGQDDGLREILESKRQDRRHKTEPINVNS